VYRDLDGKVIEVGKHGIPFVRWRPHDPRPDKDGKLMKYGQAKGTGVHAYLPFASLPLLKDPENAIVITEGEKKALCLDQLGYATIGIGGVHCWCKKGTKDLMDDLTAMHWHQRRVYVVFDYDPKPKTRRQVARAASELAAALRRQGAAEVYGIDLPPGADNSKQEVDDFIVAQGREAFDALVEASLANPLGSGDGEARKGDFRTFSTENKAYVEKVRKRLNLCSEITLPQHINQTFPTNGPCRTFHGRGKTAKGRRETLAQTIWCRCKSPNGCAGCRGRYQNTHARHLLFLLAETPKVYVRTAPDDPKTWNAIQRNIQNHGGQYYRILQPGAQSLILSDVQTHGFDREWDGADAYAVAFGALAQLPQIHGRKPVTASTGWKPQQESESPSELQWEDHGALGYGLTPKRHEQLLEEEKGEGTISCHWLKRDEHGLAARHYFNLSPSLSEALEDSVLRKVWGQTVGTVGDEWSEEKSLDELLREGRGA
jgi:hypothetical protein